MAKNDTVREKIKEIKNDDKLVETLKVVALTGVVAGLYGYRFGRRAGFRKGATLGYMAATNDIITAWREITEEMIKTRGE